MKDERKTKKQLVSELLELRRRVTELEAIEVKHIASETALKQAEEEKQTILDSLVEHVVYHDMDMKVLWANRAACESVGMSREELIGRQCYEIWAKRSDLCEDCPVEKARETGQPQALEKTTPDGRSWFIQGSPVRDNNGDIVGMVELTLEISEHKRAEEALRASEERFRTVADFTYDWEYWVAPNGDFVYVSPSCEQITGYCPDEFQRDPRIVEMMAHPDDRSLVKRHLTEEFESQEAISMEFRIITQSGEERWIGHICQPVYSTDGRWLGRRASNRDITQEKRIEKALREAHDELERRVQERTAELVKANEQLEREIKERKRAKEALQQSEAKFRTLVEQVPAISYTAALDEASTTLYISPQMETLLGYSQAEYAADPDIWRKRLHPDDRKCVLEEVHRTHARGEPLYSEYRMLAHDGRVVWFRDEAVIVKDETGQPLFLQGIMHDITKRKQTEEALRESEERFRRAFENANVGMCLVDTEGRLTKVNSRMSEIFGYSKKELEAMTVNDITHPEYVDISPKFIRRASSGEITHAEFEKQYFHKKGHLVWGQIASSVVRDVKGKPLYFISHVKDITELKKAEEERLTYQLQLRSLASELVLTEQRERRRLATDLHDSIGQLLAISKIKLSALGNVASADDIAGDLKEIRDLIAQAIEQTRSLVFELSPPVLYEFGIEAALEYLVERMQKLHDIRFEFVDDRQPKPLSEDLGVLLFRAVQELLVNIVKHARARNARTFIETKDEKIRITVEDDGVGFDISEIDSHIGRAGKFGLFSIRERLNHLGGHFEIASKPGHGTQVSLAAPLQKD